MNFFDEAYEGTPPWDIGRPQGIFVQLVEKGLLRDGPVLDDGPSRLTPSRAGA